jgi:hypothetical protein
MMKMLLAALLLSVLTQTYAIDELDQDDSSMIIVKVEEGTNTTTVIETEFTEATGDLIVALENGEVASQSVKYNVVAEELDEETSTEAWYYYRRSYSRYGYGYGYGWGRYGNYFSYNRYRYYYNFSYSYNYSRYYFYW